MENLKEEIDDHLQSLENEIQRYFPELSEQDAAIVREPFHASLDPDELQDEILELQNDSTCRDPYFRKNC